MSTETNGLKTPLYDIHVESGGKIVPFAGYLLPVQYGTGVIAEHMAVRTKCGLFDVSHMGEIILKGPDALKNLNNLLTNDYTVMADGQARYSPMCNEEGGVVDDLIVYKVRDNCYFIVVNAANKDKDYAWMKAHVTGDAELSDISASVAQLALQGPKAMDILRKVAKEEDIPEKYYTCKFHCTIDGMDCIISKTGYTGEDGVEIYLASGGCAQTVASAYGKWTGRGSDPLRAGSPRHPAPGGFHAPVRPRDGRYHLPQGGGPWHVRQDG